MKGKKIYDQCEINGVRFAILVDDEERLAYEAVWDGDGWNTDFIYPINEVESFDVYENLDFDGVRELGYRFEDDPIE